jgi:hypothetical protein
VDVLNFWERATEGEGELQESLVRRLRAKGYLTEHVRAIRYVRQLSSNRYSIVFSTLVKSIPSSRDVEMELGLGIGGLLLKGLTTP